VAGEKESEETSVHAEEESTSVKKSETEGYLGDFETIPKTRVYGGSSDVKGATELGEWDYGRGRD
jgi:hypothetical protein